MQQIKRWRSLVSGVVAGLAWLAMPAQALTFGIQEGSGSSGEADYSSNKYQPLAAALSEVLKQPVNANGLSPYRQFDAESFKRYQVVLVRPGTVAGWAIQKLDYTPLVALDNGPAPRKVVLMGSPAMRERLKTQAGLRGLKLALPITGGETYQVATSMLKAQRVNLDEVTVYSVRQQGAMPFALENKMADLAAVKSDASVFAKMKGNAAMVPVLESEALPPWVILGSKQLGPEKLAQLRQALLAMMSNPEQKALWQGLRVTNIREIDAKPYLDTYNRYGGA
ncbi:phosphate/phosphite/phosphonate ABC transporter substrate-binding protein [Leeia aquatica]|uniref:Phosphate/phosphite/phosphonate ABC transporter substrate-binding protein n=1 Tax=Leeia aquatica TaxID=2725557 RepID=A0A847SBC1_9NEIS|nr:PhnD/SsuA/transferrin family substrate-binding protein [Leeia aquatica]NLR74388.1 phosphate/phosphite/phosphonate ABC transporter substrate-binding protein [Leeia aquatica]